MRRIGWLGLVALLLMGGWALAQKPPAANGPTLPGGKPPPLTAPPERPAKPGRQAQPQPQLPEPETVARLRRLFGPDVTLAYDRAEVTDPARGAVRLAGVTLTAQGKRVAIASLSLDNLRDDGLGEAEAQGLTLRDGTTQWQVERLHLNGLVVQAAAGGPQLATLESLRATGLSVQEGSNRLRLAEAALKDYGLGQQGRIRLAGLELTLPPGTQASAVRLQRAELRGLDLARLVADARASRTPSWHGRYALELEALTVLRQGGTLASLASLRVAANRPENAVGTDSFAMRALRVEPMPDTAAALQRLGYTTLNFDLTGEGRYDPATGTSELTSLSLVGQQIGTLALNATLSGLTTDAMQRMDWGNLRLVTAGLRYIDQGLVGRLVGAQAREANQPANAVREQWANLAGGALAAPALSALREAVQQFLRGPAQELAVTLRPPQPLALQELQRQPPASPEDAMQRLGLTATAR